MGVSTFKGGVHPYDGKELAMDKAIVDLRPEGLMVYPLSQHIGAPATPLVQKGDRVLMGQKIAEATGFISAPVISSVSGTVKSIEKRLTVGGSMVESIVVENDQEYETIPGFGEKRDYTKLSKEEIVQIVKDAGIVGLGGAGFPTSVKLCPKNPDKIDYFLANAVECEPYLTSDYRDMLETPEKLIGGLKVVLSLFPNAKGKMAAISMTTVIQMVMLFVSALILFACKTKAKEVGNSQVFRAGIVALVSVYGVAWMADTYFASHMGVLKTFLGSVVTQHPWTYGLVLFFTSKLVNSQGAAVAIVMPMALSLGMDPVMVMSFLPACYGYFFLPTYPSDLACIGFDRSGTTRIGKFVLNHSFMLPGLIGVICACGMSFVIAHAIL